MKSERLKKLESEIQDLEQWLRLGLVPKRDVEKHKIEIASLKKKIDEELERLREIKENGDGEEYSAPKRTQAGRQAYQEPHTLPGIDLETEGLSDAGLDMDSESFETESSMTGGDERSGEYTISEEDDEDPFSDRNRWRRGVLEDPDVDQW